jgi:hypothetical protein
VHITLVLAERWLNRDTVGFWERARGLVDT